MKKIILCFLFCTLCLSMAQPPYFIEVQRACKETGVPVYIVMGVIIAESEGSAKAVSPRRPDGHRDEGIMQLNSKYLFYFTWRFNRGQSIDPFSPKDAIPVGVRILACNYRYYGNWVEALAAYRQGIYGVYKNGVTHASFHYIETVFKKGAPYKTGADS